MAQPESQPQTQTVEVEYQEKKLKYLDFFQVAVVYAVVWVSSVYVYAKENSGPLKPGVNAVEGTVKTVVGPVYEKLHDIPFELLNFLDHKMEELLKEVDNRVPHVIKQAPKLVRTVASDIQQTGLISTGTHLAKSVYTKYEPTAKELYVKYEPIAEKHAVSAWRSLNGIPLFRQVASIMVPTGVYWAEKYNKTVSYVGERGFAVAGYMPFVPIEKIGKIFEGDVATIGEYVAVAQ